MSKWMFWKKVVQAPITRINRTPLWKRGKRCPTCGHYDEIPTRQTQLAEFFDAGQGKQTKLEEYA